MIQFFLSDISASSCQGHIFLSESISFSTLASQIHQMLQNPKDIDIYVYINSAINISSLNILENFEILFEHSLINSMTFVIDRENPNFHKMTRAIRFMHDVYQYKVSSKIAEYQIISINI